MDKEKEVLSQLETIIDPDLGKDIVSLGFVKNLKVDDGQVSFILELTTPACPVKEKFREECYKVIKQLAWVRDVSLTLTSSTTKPLMAKAGEGLQGVRYIVAVASCKGGVGKSTTAVNLAFSIASKGASVGIFDADIYGPSLQTLVNAEFNGLFQQGNLIIPVEYKGLKLMSFAYASANTGGGPAIMRGPMVTQVINQLLCGTQWGDLDYLIIDMPPGTGDTQLTLSQIIPMTAAVIVTTPQELSFVDVVKGIQMFDKMKIPTVAVVENMSYFTCNNCNTKHEVFGTGSMKKLVQQFGFKNAFSLPIDTEISRLSDIGAPFVLERPNSSVTEQFSAISDAVVQEISKLVYGNDKKPAVSYDPDRGIIFTSPSEKNIIIKPAKLRGACRCAHCINEMTGEQVLRPEDIREDITPKNINPLGNYAVTISWSDGHSSIFPYEMFEKINASQDHA